MGGHGVRRRRGRPRISPRRRRRSRPIAELGGYGPDVLADEAVAHYLALGSRPGGAARGGPGTDREGGDPGGRTGAGVRRRPSPEPIAGETAAKARRLNSGVPAAELEAGVLAAVAADDRLDAARRAELAAALETAFAAPAG